MERYKSYVVEGVSLLYILLFVYAAVNKLIDFENFQVQLAQSPLLSSFARWVSWITPITEILIAVILIFPQTRLVGLYGSFALMVMFDAYIVIMLKFSPFVPCSCGGILEKLSWEQHLVFNIFFTLISLPALLFMSKIINRRERAIYHLKVMSIILVLSSSIIALLFLLSEDMIHHRNNFTRRFPNHPAEFVRDLKLDVSRPYIAGVTDDGVFIGDLKNPLEILEYRDDLLNHVRHTISTSEPRRKYRSLKVNVQPPFFYLHDGVEAFVYRGKVDDWKATLWLENLAYYNSFVLVDSIRVAIRALSRQNENMIGIMEKGEHNHLMFNRSLLDKQIDGVFDTDGKLLYNAKHRKIIYVYTYRNEYVITDTRLKSKVVGHTIDTTSRANIKVQYVEAKKASKIASPMRIVNKFAATDDDYLYVHSKLIGQLEQKDMWDEASIIDVYNILNKAYLFSFYLYDKEQKKVYDFVVLKGKIYTLAGRTLTVYNLDPIPFERNK